MAASTGIDRHTGAVLSDFAHVKQSILVIFTTRIGSRVMRRSFGSAIPALLLQNLEPANIARFFAAICIAIDLWEPRFRVISISLPPSLNSSTLLRSGRFGVEILGLYYPYALRGDRTPDPTPRTVTL